MAHFRGKNPEQSQSGISKVRKVASLHHVAVFNLSLRQLGRQLVVDGHHNQSPHRAGIYSAGRDLLRVNPP